MSEMQSANNTGAQTVTESGRHLIAKLIAGDTMTITRIQFGSGAVGPGEDIRYRTDLVQPVATGTSAVPTVDGGTATILCEYNNTLNGGLTQGFWISEFGIYAEDPDDGEVLIFYATLGDFPHWVSAYATNRIDTVRFHVTIAIGEDRGIEAAYNTSLWMTEEDVHRCYYEHLHPVAMQGADQRIAAHNINIEAHPYILNQLAKQAAQISLLQLLVLHGAGGVQFLITFDRENIGKSEYAGVWNTESERMEW